MSMQMKSAGCFGEEQKGQTYTIDNLICKIEDREKVLGSPIKCGRARS
jgi:hypothetical protein